MDSLTVDSLRHVVDSLKHIAAATQTVYAAPNLVLLSPKRDWFDWVMLVGTWLGVIAAPIIAIYATRFGARLARRDMLAAREQELAAEAARRDKQREEERKERRQRIKRTLEYTLLQVYVGAKVITDQSDTETIPSERLLAMREACAAKEALLEDMHLLLPLEEETNIRSNLTATVALAEATLENERVILRLEDEWRAGHGSPNSLTDARARRKEHWKAILNCRQWSHGKMESIEKL